ncbi:MAG: metallophosphoesterase family protein [Candidatus Aenigmarchaeota archaeon]|nr:metallophosphoesterase family protein [Candidatus Aenigmarchaeota archaeon]
MKILAVSDLHNDFRQVKKLAEQAEKENVDAVIICGDITYFDEYMDGMIGPFLKKNKQVLFIPGNHDSEATTDFITKKYGIKNLHGEAVTIGDVSIFGAGWTTNVGPTCISEKDMKNYLERGFEKSEEGKRVMITHIHPKGSRIEKKFKFPGSSSVAKAIYELKPDVHFCGHIHEAEGMEEFMGKTHVFSLGKHGRIVEI